MRQAIGPCLFVALAVCTSCAQPSKAPAPLREAPGTAHTPETETLTPQPRTRPTVNLALRPTPQWQRLLELQQEYLGKEGATRRGRAFSDLAMAVNMMRGPSSASHEAITELQVLALLGPPDFGYSVSTGAEMIYSYWRPELNEDWAVLITINSRGLLTRIGWNRMAALVPSGELNPFHWEPGTPESMKVDANS